MARSKYRLFIVDDDAANAEMLRKFIEEKFSYQVLSFTNGDDALRNMNLIPTFVLLDYDLDRAGAESTNGLDVLTRIRRTHPKAYVIVLSRQDKLDVATNTTKLGAFDYVVKNPAVFLRVENSLRHIDRMLRDKATIRRYQTAALILTALLLVAGLTVMLLLQNTGAL